MHRIRPSFDGAPASSTSDGTIGVLGGMGPLATVDFMHKLVRFTTAERDQDHIPLVIASVPQIPDRSSAWLDGGPSPLAALCESGSRLLAAGAEVIVMPCNTAHLWFDEVRQALRVPMIDLVAAATEEALAASRSRRIGLLGTRATLQSGLYARGIGREVEWILPEQEQSREVTRIIDAVKAGSFEAATGWLDASLDALERRGAEVIILACTELPLVLRERSAGVPVVDSTAALARKTVAWSVARRANAAAAAGQRG